MIRRWPRPHPSYERLSLHADGELSATEAMELNAHLAGCTECREEVDFMVDLRERLRAISGPVPPPDLFPEVLTLRAQGERVVLGVEPVGSASTRRLETALPAMALIVVSSIGFAFFGASEIAAGASRLDLPEAWTGSEAPAEYRTAGSMAARPEVRLRAVFFDRPLAVSGPLGPREVAVDLERRGNGRFTGLAALPSSAVYARFVVEDPTGESIDPGDETWEYLARNENGQPTFEALLAKLRFHEERLERGASLETAGRLTDLYADRADAWFWQAYLEGVAESELGEDSRLRHLARLDALVEGLGALPSPRQLALLADYAHEIGDPVASEFLISKLLAVAPGHTLTATYRLHALSAEHWERPQDLMSALEVDWDRYGSLPRDVWSAVMMMTTMADDARAAVRWYDRWVASVPADQDEAAAFLAEIPTMTGGVLARLREPTRSGLVPGIRPVGTSVSAHRRAVSRARRRLLTRLAGAELVAGDRAAALDLYREAAELGWAPQLFGTVARLAETLDRPDAATAYYVRALVDPLVTSEEQAEYRAGLARLGGEEPELRARREAASEEMVRRILAGRVPRKPNGPLTLELSSGGAVDLTAIRGPRATIVQMWSPASPETVTRVRDLIGHCEALVARGIRVIAVSHDPLDGVLLPDLESAASCGDVLFFDARREIRDQLQSWTYGEALVLDSEGRVRHQGSDPDGARRAALILADRY